VKSIHSMIEETLTYTYYSGVHERWFGTHATSPASPRILPCLAIVYAHEEPYHFIVKDTQQCHTAVKDEMVLVPGNVAHSLRCPDGCHLSAAHIQYAMLGNLDPLSLFVVPNHLDRRRTRFLRKAFFELIDRNAEPAQTLTAIAERRAGAFQFLADLLRWCRLREDSLKLMDHVKRLQPVLSYIETNIGRRIGREELAKVAHLSQPHFSDLFREAMGMAPMQFVQRARQKQALALLRESDLSIDQVAERTGFCDQFHFCRQFKKILGITPSDYRKMLAQGGIAWMPPLDAPHPSR